VTTINHIFSASDKSQLELFSLVSKRANMVVPGIEKLAEVLRKEDI